MSIYAKKEHLMPYSQNKSLFKENKLQPHPAVDTHTWHSTAALGKDFLSHV